MKVLVVGGGGREHALAWKIAKSPKLTKLYCAPGNAGIASVAECVNIAADDLDGLARFARGERIDLTVVGPEVALCEGIYERFERDDLKIFGPTGRAAELEGSKVFAKNLMRKQGIPTAEYQVFEDQERAVTFVTDQDSPFVVKADGLAAGKGVIVADSVEETIEAIKRVFDGEFGDGNATVVLEEILTGEEASILAFTDGTTIAPLASSQDHKPIFDGDTGPNTGGMGAYSPAPIVTPALMEKIEREVLVPVVHGLAREGRPYKGVLYAGIMVTPSGPKVLEFNVRMGDPETQPLLMRMKSDILEHMMAVVEERLEDEVIEWDARPATCVVMAAGGYPSSYKKGRVISGLDDAKKLEGTYVFHAGTKKDNDDIVTNGGRVLGVTALGDTIKDSIDNAYRAVECISWDDEQHRTDIGKKAL